jgi:hypothetical protein
METLERKPIVDKCIGCENIIEENKCRIWGAPAAKWRIGVCPSATHVKVGITSPEQKVRVGQQKQKKTKK